MTPWADLEDFYHSVILRSQGSTQYHQICQIPEFWFRPIWQSELLNRRNTITTNFHLQTRPVAQKLHNSNSMSEDWIDLNVQQNFNGRNEHIQIFNNSNDKVGRNLLVNRFKNLSNKISYSWLNESLDTFKVKCKKLLL